MMNVQSIDAKARIDVIEAVALGEEVLERAGGLRTTAPPAGIAPRSPPARRCGRYGD
jgi:hypothetical protein